MNCPICGYEATQASNTYWCPHDRIFLGDLVLAGPGSTLISKEAPKPSQTENRAFPKIFNKVLWVAMGVLYLTVILVIVGAYLTGAFDTTSIFN
ncbi:MAG: hypothetical protein Q8O75_00495 [bacterium]|nr:hypothetical protein [bacterium]